MHFLSVGMFRVREYASYDEAVQDDVEDFVRIPSVVPAASTQIWHVFSYDTSERWTRFRLPKENRSELTALIHPIAPNLAVRLLPFVPRSIRHQWPRELRRMERPAGLPAGIRNYSFFTTRDSQVGVAIDEDSDWVYMWTTPELR
jgi:hypothetical protein